MGLDVYLYRGDFEASRTHFYEDHEDDMPGPAAGVQEASKLHPDHMFKIGYFRSSYNDGGVDRILRAAGAPTLGQIFDAGDDYIFRPNWQTSLERAKMARVRLERHIEATGGVRCFSTPAVRFRNEQDGPVLSEVEAMRIFKEHWGKRPKDPVDPERLYGYSCSDGEFMFGKEAMRVRALIPGTDALKRPCLYVVHEQDDRLGWYLQALDIVIETIMYVLNQPDPNLFHFHWSA